MKRIATDDEKFERAVAELIYRDEARKARKRSSNESAITVARKPAGALRG